MKGDLDGHSTLIARNHDELELLKHKGDRNYYEFTLTKGKRRKPVGTVSLELKKADPKKNTFNLVVISDDKPVQKNGKGMNEPLQFYSGKSTAALRGSGQLDRFKESGERVSDHAEERADAA